MDLKDYLAILEDDLKKLNTGHPMTSYYAKAVSCMNECVSAWNKNNAVAARQAFLGLTRAYKEFNTKAGQVDHRRPMTEAFSLSKAQSICSEILRTNSAKY